MDLATVLGCLEIFINTDTYIDIDELRRIGPPLPAQGHGVTLWKWLADHFPFYSTDQWAVEIAQGRVAVNQYLETSPHRLLSSGDRLGRLHPLSEEPEVDTQLSIIWQDDNVAVVSKPAGLPMHEAAFFRRKTVHWLLPKFMNGDWHAVHRLDRETSGILVCAKGPKLRKILAQALESRDVTKTYLALCHGRATQDEWHDRRFLLPSMSAHERSRCVEDSHPEAKSAHTHFRVIERRTNHTLIEASPFTGRTHQIRVHLAESRLPIVGDKIYGTNPEVFARYIRDGNTPEVKSMAGHPHHLLHAWKISFKHPINGQTIDVTAPPPAWPQTPV